MSTLGNALVAAGAIVGVGTVALVATGTEITLTPEMIQLLIYKGLAAAAVGLIVVGSWVGRRARQHERQTGPADVSTPQIASGASVPLTANHPREEKIRESS